MGKSAFKQLYSDMINSGGDVSAVAAKMGGSKKQILCYVKESFPYFMVSDEYFYVPCYFTSKAVNDFKSKNSVNVTDLRGSVIVISDYTLEMVSSSAFTSYAGVEIRLVVKGFRVSEAPKAGSNAKNAQNLYRDNEIKNLFNNYVHRNVVKAVAGATKGDSLPDVGKKGKVDDGVLKAGWGGVKGSATSTMDMVAIYK